MPVKLPDFPLNPNYGGGIFRRSARLTNREGETSGELEDDMHGMRCTVRHDGRRITAVESDPARLPLNTCAGASAPLQELVGQPLDVAAAWFYGDGRPRRNCTHLYDLVWWTISHAARGTPGVRRYDAQIPDAPDSTPVDICLLRDGEPLLVWRAIDGVIQTPELFAGRDILRGFAAFAASVLDGEELEAAFFLQKAYFVSGARRLARSKMVGPLTPTEEVLRGACWTFNSPQFEQAIRRDSSRDFSDRPEDLLFFR